MLSILPLVSMGLRLSTQYFTIALFLMYGVISLMLTINEFSKSKNMRDASVIICSIFSGVASATAAGANLYYLIGS